MTTDVYAPHRGGGRRHATTVLVGAALVAGPWSLVGAQVGAAAAPAVAVPVRGQVAEQVLSTSPPTAANVGTATRAFLTASNGDATAKISGGFDLLDQSPLTLSLRLGAETPLAKGAEDATLTDFRRLTGGTSVSLDLQGTIWRSIRDYRPSALIQWCREKKQQNPDLLPDVATCDSFTSQELDNVPRALYLEFLRAAGWTEPWVFELTSKAARANQRFLDASTFAPDSQDRVAYSVGGSVGRTFTALGPVRAGLLSVGYEYQVKYKAQDSAQVCMPTGPSGALQCRGGPLGAPTQRQTNAVTGEFRGFFSRRWGFAPRAALLVRERDWELALPLYFVPNKDGLLIGGVEPSFTTDGNDWGVRVFVGATGFGLDR